MKKGIIYSRQSFGQEENSVSLEVQEEQCKAWAKKNGITIIGIYSDANTSSELYPYCAEGIEAARVDRGFQIWKKEQRTKGRKDYKEGLGQAFDAIKAQRPDYLIVYTENRLGRSATNSNLKNFTTSFLMDYRCSLVDVQSNSIMDFSDKLMMAFRVMKDALDYQSVAEKRKASMESVAKRINSFKVISKAYGVITNNGVIGFDPAKAEVIRYIFDSVLEGYGMSQILASINKRYKHLADGKQFYGTNVEHTIKNLLYCGYAKDKSGNIGRAVNIPEPVVSFSVWQKANEIVANKKAGYQKCNLKGHKKIHWLPYSGYLKCDCGRRLQVTFDNGTVYHCLNAGEHTNRIRMNAINHNQDFYLTMQSLFIVSCIKSRKQLEASRRISNRIDGLKAKQITLENSLKAKFRMISTDEDYELFKSEIDAIKQEIATIKQELIMAEEERNLDAEAVQSKIDTDFATIMYPRLLDEASYQRLLQETIKDIVVKTDSITVNLTDGNSFDLPRLLVNGRGKKVLPWSDILASTESVENLDAITHYKIIFHGGTENKVLVEAENYSIEIVADAK